MIPTTCTLSSNRIEAHKQKNIYVKFITENHSIASTLNWLKKTRKELESFVLVFAAQEQATLKTITDPHCRIYGLAPESIPHILSACPTKTTAH